MKEGQAWKYGSADLVVSKMAIAFDLKQIVLNDELLLFQMISQEGIVRLIVRKGVFNKEEVLKMEELVDLKIAGKV